MSGAVTGSAELQINGEYVLLGGTGTGSFDLNYRPLLLQGPTLQCSVVIDGGNAQKCNSPVTVEYGVAFIMDVELSVFAVGGHMAKASRGGFRGFRPAGIVVSESGASTGAVVDFAAHAWIGGGGCYEITRAPY